MRPPSRPIPAPISWVAQAIGFALIFATNSPAFASAAIADPTTLKGKVVFGYQGWFDCPMAGKGSWIHWCRNGAPTAFNLTVDLYPDLKEFDAADLCPAGDLKIGTRQAQLYSARNANIVDGHFRWMEENGLDGVLVQRFGGEASWKRSGGDEVLRNIMAAAARHGRVFAMEYDISGLNDSNIHETLQKDWMYLVDSVKVTAHPNYLHENGKPVLAVWGLGLNDAAHPPGDAAAAAAFIRWFRTDAAVKYRVCYVGGTPAYWRTLDNDARTEAGWKEVYRSMDVIQPWTVGRYVDSAGAARWRKDMLVPDLLQIQADGKQYMPVIFPGFSWKNLNNGPGNQIPRKGGRFFWQQAMNAKAAGATMLKIAMFDEVDEGTAMFKVVSKRSDAPDTGFWLTWDADGLDLPSDWYLKLAGEVTQVFHGSRPPSDTLPFRPDALPTAIRTRVGPQIRGLGMRLTRGGEIELQRMPYGAALQILDTRGRKLRALKVKSGDKIPQRCCLFVPATD